MKKINLEKKLEIVEYYNSGLKAKEIAPLFGLTEVQVYSVIKNLRKSGVMIPKKLIIKKKFKKHPAVHLNKQEIDDIVRKYESGVSTRNICIEYKITPSMLYTHMNNERRKGRVIKRKWSPRGDMSKMKRSELLPSVDEVKEMVGKKDKKEGGTIDWKKVVDESMRIEQKKAAQEMEIASNIMRMKDVTLNEWFKAKVAKLLIKILS